LRGRAEANDALEWFPSAVADAQRAVALMGQATREDGHRERHLLVRVLGRWNAAGDENRLRDTLTRWRFAFEHGDIAAGYMLVAHHARLASPQQHDLLVELYRRVPNDDSLGIALARSYRSRKEWKRARQELTHIAQRSPARAEQVADLLAQLEQERERTEEEARLEEEGLSDRERRALAQEGSDIVGKRRRFGLRLELGTDVHTTASALLGVGFYRTTRVARGLATVTRFDWTQRDDQMESVSAFASSFGIVTRVFGTRQFELAAGIAPRLELRYGGAENSSWDRVALAGDITVELLPRALPAALGVSVSGW
jgi:hypothetical protein